MDVHRGGNVSQVDARDTSDSMAGIWLKRLDERKTTGPSKATRSRSGGLSERKSRLTFSFGIDLERDVESNALIGSTASVQVCLQSHCLALPNKNSRREKKPPMRNTSRRF